MDAKRISRSDDDDDDDAGPWGVYEIFCQQCGRKIVVVATVHSVDHGYAEGMSPALCSNCHYWNRTGAMN